MANANAEDRELSTDEELDSLAERFDNESAEQPTRPRSKSSLYDDSDDTSDSQIPPLDESDDSQSDDAAGTEAGEDDETDDQAKRQAIADAYGLDVEALSGFSTAKDAEAALALMDAQFAAASRQRSQQQQWDQFPQQPLMKQPPTQQQVAAELAELQLQIDEWEKDDPLAKNFSAISGAINPMVKEVQFLRNAVVAMYQENVRREQIQREQNFHATLDRINPQLFGTAEKSTPLQQRYRERLIDEFNVLEAGYIDRAQRFGAPVPPMEKLIERAMRAAFANQLAKDKRTQKQPDSPNNSRRPRLGTPGRGRSSKEGQRAIDFDGDIEDNPALHRLYKQLEEASEIS